jgi:hypothetical protein
MRRRQIYEAGADYIDRLLLTLGCSRGSVPPQPGPRHERLRPNELWHIDIKAPLLHQLGEAWVP